MEQTSTRDPYAAIPEELRLLQQWVCFKRVPKRQRDGTSKLTKLPFNPHTGRLASTDNPATWGTFAETLAAIAKHAMAGLGLVFTAGDDYAGLDVDGCRDPETGVIADWAQDFVTRLASYTEISPSGTGLHTIVRVGRDDDTPSCNLRYQDGKVEIYRFGRYFTVTGDALPGAPLTIAERREELAAIQRLVEQARASGPSRTLRVEGGGRFPAPTCGVTGLSVDEVLRRCREDSSGEKFSAIYDDGDLRDVGGDASVADYFIWSKLAFYIGDDPGRIADVAEQGAHYLRLDDPAQAQARERKWQRAYPPYASFEMREIAKVLAERGPEDIWGGAADLHGVIFADFEDGGGDDQHVQDDQQQGQWQGASAPVSGAASAHEPVNATAYASVNAAVNTPVNASVKAWPAPLANDAYYGVLGEIARGVEPFIEADSAALLINLIAASGIAMGRATYIQVGAARHRGVLDIICVGESGDNKSDSTTPLRAILQQPAAPSGADLDLPPAPVVSSGLSTGEGLLWQIRDERWELVTDKKSGVATPVLVDPGVRDKRLLVIEHEFARVLAVMGREGNTLSTTLRDLYDSPEAARSAPKNNPVTATAPHVGLIGLITPAELQRKLKETELYNGFANRFLWALTHRVTSRPTPPDYTATAEAHARLWHAAIRRSWTVEQITRDAAAEAQWAEVYERLRRGGRDGLPPRRGLALETCARAHVQVLRIALIFAALDGSSVITTTHQTAALAIWDYSERCSAYLFGDLSGDPVEDTIAAALRNRGRMSRDEARALFSRHVEAQVLEQALTRLAQAGKARRGKTKTNGRPVEIWEWVAQV